MIGWLFGLGGATAGTVQAGLLVWSVCGRPGSLAALLRFSLVAAVLVIAARAGHLVPGAAGWLGGFAVASACAVWRLR
ncbi:MAG: hypothetical protein ACYDCL_00595 [Myxococcales bacterium]